jgi:hypothetical protein
MKTLKTIENRTQLIYPGDREQVYFWTKKWRVTDGQLNEAIIETGSIQVKVIKNYLAEKGLVFSFPHFIRRLKG